MEISTFFFSLGIGLVVTTLFIWFLFSIIPKIGKRVVKILKLNTVYTFEYVDFAYFGIGFATLLVITLMYFIGKDAYIFVLNTKQFCL